MTQQHVTIRQRPMQKADDWQVWLGRKIIARGMRTRELAEAWAKSQGYAA